MRTRRTFGALRRLPSGRWQAHYTGPDGLKHPAPVTFDTKTDADEWLSLRRSEMTRGEWAPKEKAASERFGDYARTWIEGRDLKPRTAAEYRRILRDHLMPAFGDRPLDKISAPMVRAWHAGLAKRTGPTARAHAYALLRTIMGTAVTDDLIVANPCRIRSAGSAKRARKVRPATLAEMATIAETVPPRYRAMMLLAAWCALRFGELTELRRGDVDDARGVLHVRRGVVRADGKVIVGTPKSEAGVRDVAIPPHLTPMLREHLAEHTGKGRDALLFPAANGVDHMAPATLYRVFYRAREAAGRPDLRFHDLRHTGATLAAVSGATLRELMSRIGHSTPGAALLYQHVASDRDRVIADAMSELAAAAVVVPISSAKRVGSRAAGRRAR